MSEKKKYRTWTVPQKLEIVLAGLRGDRSAAEICREHLVELRKRVRDLERTLGRKTYELEILGNGFRTWE